ncbi:MAG TPA: collagen-like protein, partial [Myxococcaceae bacterium]|nr:collagen-like protein [Myxococcaceae bacterium]
FSSITIDGTLVVPSGMVLRSTGDVTVRGTLSVLPGTQDSGNGEAQPGVSVASAGLVHGGIGLSTLQAAQVVRPGIAAGGAGGRVTAGSGGEGGGSVVLVAKGNLLVSSTGRIEANGRNGSSGANVVGTGGGAGGVIVLVAKGALTVQGTVSAMGGNGASATTTGGNGEGGGGGGGGGIIHFLSTSAATLSGTIKVDGGAGGSNAVGGTYTNAGYGGGACGGNGGNGGGQEAFGAPLTASQAGSVGHILRTVAPEPELLLMR